MVVESGMGTEVEVDIFINNESNMNRKYEKQSSLINYNCSSNMKIKKII